MPKINLDRQNDVLYIAFSDMSNSYGDEDNGTITFYDLVTDQITGVTIFDFLKKYYNDEMNSITLPPKVDFIRDIYPFLNFDL